VGGVIRGDVEIHHSRLTIAGQTAPAPGVTLEGRILARPPEGERLQDVVIRFLRVRPRPTSGHGGDAIQLPSTDRLILDHVSMSWGNDELLDVIYSGDVTVQWSTFEESDTRGHGKGGIHNFGMLATYPGSGNISIHHNLFAHQSQRSPSLAPYEPNRPGDVRNNVVYNFRAGLTHDGHVPKAGINLIGNYYQRGPSARHVTPFQFASEGQYYLAGNYLAEVGGLEHAMAYPQLLPRWVELSRKGRFADQPFPVAVVATDTACEAYVRVLDRAGAWPRDRVTRRTVSEVDSDTGAWGRDAPEEPTDEWFTRGLEVDSPLPDRDGDGMPDEWERTRGLDPDDPGDAWVKLEDGYPALDIYLAERAERLVAGGGAFSQPGSCE
jgi:hypothetical protein